MKFSCEKAVLQGAIATAARAVAPKSSIPSLEGLLVECTAKGLRLTGYNLITGITTLVDAEIREEGALVLPARLFGEIVRRLPDDMAAVESRDNNVKITCGPAAFDILGEQAEDFPELPEVDRGNRLVMTQERMRDMIARVLFAVSDNESRPIHTGALFDVDPERLTLVAVDGYRMAIRREPVSGTEGAPTFSFVVPAAALTEVEKICGETEEPVTIVQGERHVTFQMGDTLLVARRLEGQFLDYKNTIPKQAKFQMTVDTQELQDSLNRVGLIISEKLKSPVLCRFEKDGIAMTSRTALGSVFDRCPAAGDGGGMEVGFNNRFLLEAARNCPADAVRLEVSSPIAPCLMLPLEGDDFLYMVLPVRIRAED